MEHSLPLRPASQRHRSFKAHLLVLIVLTLLIWGSWISMTRGLRPGVPLHSVGPMASVTLSPNSKGQTANRIAIDASGLHWGSDVIVPVKITNAGNQALSGILAKLVSTNPGIQMAVESAPSVGPNSSVDVNIRLRATSASSGHASQVVVSFSPAVS